MKRDREEVRAYYNQNALMEWERIGGRPEFLLTCRLLDRLIPNGARVLDLGGGPGRYSIHLAGRGCDVTLCDLAQENVRLAREKAAEAGVSIHAVAGDALEADSLVEGPFDAVLLMGPLYHLLEEEERDRAMRTALGLLKPGGMFFASFILTIADLIYRMKDPEGASVRRLFEGDPAEEEFRRCLLDGWGYAGDAFTRAFFADLGEIRPFMERYPLDGVTLFAQEGILSPCEGGIMALPAEERTLWLDLAFALAERPEYLGWAEHVLAYGRKRSC